MPAMSKYVLVLTLIFTQSASACLRLAGVYSCGRERLTFNTTLERGTYSYDMNGFTFVADNQVRGSRDHGSSFTYKASCNDDSFRVKTIVGRPRTPLEIVRIFRPIDEHRLSVYVRWGGFFSTKRMKYVCTSNY